MDLTASGDTQKLGSLSAQQIKAAFSSLTTFACEFTSGQGLLAQAVEGPDGPSLHLSVIDASDLPRDTDAVCRVDWSWIVGSTLQEAGANKSALKLKLNPAGPLIISVNLWQGKPFLSFQPYRSA